MVRVTNQIYVRIRANIYKQRVGSRIMVRVRATIKGRVMMRISGTTRENI